MLESVGALTLMCRRLTSNSHQRSRVTDKRIVGDVTLEKLTFLIGMLVQ